MVRCEYEALLAQSGGHAKAGSHHARQLVARVLKANRRQADMNIRTG
jgi:hypothetical protein